MKRYIKSAFKILITICILFCLCSCDMIDEMRENRAYFLDDTKDIIVFNEKEYKRLPEISGAEINAELYVTVCEQEVPLLLTEFYGDYFFYNEKETLITDSEGNNYCREDLYEEYSSKIKYLFLDNYCVETVDYDSETLSKKILLDKSTVDIINKILTTVKPQQNELYFDNCVSVYSCDENIDFIKYDMDIGLADNGTYYISYYLENSIQHYAIPQEYSALFEEIIENSGY